MDKINYNRAEIVVTEFETDDIITSSSIDQDNDDLEILHGSGEYIDK